MTGKDDLEKRSLAWAERQDDIRAVLLVGSRARGDGRADELSDIDLILFTTNVERYHASPDWLAEIGAVWVFVSQEVGDGYPEHLAVFDSGHKVDFAFFPVSDLEALVQGERLPNVYRRGYKVLVDKDGTASKLPTTPFPLVHQKPSHEAFNRLINQFWYNAYQVAKAIRRDELWVAMTRDHLLKANLLQMIEWHAQAEHNWHHDTWHGGRFMSEWASQTVLNTLPQTFAHLNRDDLWRGLTATIELFQQLAEAVAASLGYNYPITVDKKLRQYINGLYTSGTPRKTL